MANESEAEKLARLLLETGSLGDIVNMAVEQRAYVRAMERLLEEKGVISRGEFSAVLKEETERSMQSFAEDLKDRRAKKALDSEDESFDQTQ